MYFPSRHLATSGSRINATWDGMSSYHHRLDHLNYCPPRFHIDLLRPLLEEKAASLLNTFRRRNSFNPCRMCQLAKDISISFEIHVLHHRKGAMLAQPLFTFILDAAQLPVLALHSRCDGSTAPSIQGNVRDMTTIIWFLQSLIDARSFAGLKHSMSRIRM